MYVMLKLEELVENYSYTFLNDPILSRHIRVLKQNSITNHCANACTRATPSNTYCQANKGLDHINFTKIDFISGNNNLRSPSVSKLAINIFESQN